MSTDSLSEPQPLPGADGSLEALQEQAQHATPTDLHDLVNRHATACGLQRVVIHLVDIQQRRLASLGEGRPPLSVDTSTAGWTYRTMTSRVEEAGDGSMLIWLPLVDGVERLGVLEVHSAVVDAPRMQRARALASLLAPVITSKRAYSDTFVRQSRTRPMEVPAEMVRAFLPPRTIGNDQGVSTAVLEPAYEMGGDAFDHAMTRSTLHTSIVDSMGHDLAAGLATAVVMASCRSGRRAGADLRETVATIDKSLSRWLPDRFATGIFAQLDLASGRLRWINCGHPPPLLIRRDTVLAGALERPGQLPMGLPSSLSDEPRTVHEAGLEPGDRVLMYTDGVTDVRGADGEVFGLERFTDSIIRASAAGELAFETLRRLIHFIVDDQDNELRDDATLLLLEWRPGDGGSVTAPGRPPSY
ncbi:PP2C family protein-serine/threonine phosphatase [Streptomyces sp. NPDC059740]|uniref:PP2C family protein-serine/threonine phosphatase n=1 Tax=Streptomyces sp. NPDC059740 TaxID=3346926 RepID=UPI00364F55F4